MKRIRHLSAVLILCGLTRPLYAPIGEIDVHSGPPPEAPVPQDASTLWIEAKTRITMLLTDSKGRRTGLDPKTKKVYQEIPGSKCDVDYVENKYTGEQQAEAYEHVSIQPVSRGLYKVALRGLQAGPFEVNISALSSDGSSEPSKQLEGLISEGEGKLFRLTFDPAPNALLSIVESDAR